MKKNNAITMTKTEREKVLNLLEELSKQIEEKKKNKKKKSFFEKMIEKTTQQLTDEQSNIFNIVDSRKEL